MADLLLDCNVDAKDRLWELLERRNVSYRNQLKQSVGTAGAQLEWAKPSVMGSAKRDKTRFYGGPAVMAPPGTVFIVLAHDKKAFTIWLRPSPGNSLTDVIEQSVKYAEQLMEPDTLSGVQVLLAAKDLIRKYGQPPGKHGVELEQEHNTRIIGMLLAGVPERDGMVDGLEMIVGMGVCPAVVGLIGKGSETGLCGAWPLVLPLAPYVDAVVAA
jgi:hypothetical protein